MRWHCMQGTLYRLYVVRCWRMLEMFQNMWQVQRDIRQGLPAKTCLFLKFNMRKNCIFLKKKLVRVPGNQCIHRSLHSLCKNTRLFQAGFFRNVCTRLRLFVCPTRLDMRRAPWQNSVPKPDLSCNDNSLSWYNGTNFGIRTKNLPVYWKRWGRDLNPHKWALQAHA